MTAESARHALRQGRRVKMTVGEHPEDPVLIVYADDGAVFAEVIAGWSAGVVEPVCSIDSGFLLGYLAKAERLEIA